MIKKIITVDIFLSVMTSQDFEVPVDYEIKGTTPLEAYLNLIDDFEDQNPNAINRPEWVELGEYGSDFVGLRDEFCIHNEHTKEKSIKRFDSEKVS
jgi:hypothetical protein